MFFASQRPARLSLCVSVAAYAVGTALAGTVTALGAHRVGIAMLHEVAPMTRMSEPRTVPAAQAQRTAVASPRLSTAPRHNISVPASAVRSAVVRRAVMTPTSDRWIRHWSRDEEEERRPRVTYFGFSSRFAARPDFDSYSRDWDERPDHGGTYRTMCVRLCDGYYYPVSFSVTPDRFEHDAQVCERTCGGEGRLFVYPNPGGDIEGMQDLRGRPYAQLRTAFLYRTTYVDSCKCQPRPWEEASTERHRMYALEAARRKGSKDAARELSVLQAKAREAARSKPRTALAGAKPAAAPRVMGPQVPESLGTSGAEMRSEAPMALGAPRGSTPRRITSPPRWESRREQGWERRAFDRY